MAALALVISILRNRQTERQLALTSIMKTVEWMEEQRPYRRVLYRLRDEGKSLEEWSEEEREAAYRVTRWLDILGVLDSLGFVDRRLIDRFYAVPASEIWEMCSAYVKNQQELRGPQHLWELEQFAQRVRYVKQNHPAFLVRHRWPCRPRQKPKRCTGHSSGPDRHEVQTREHQR